MPCSNALLGALHRCRMSAWVHRPEGMCDEQHAERPSVGFVGEAVGSKITMHMSRPHICPDCQDQFQRWQQATARRLQTDKTLQAHDRQDDVGGMLTGTALVQRSCTLNAHCLTSGLSHFASACRLTLSASEVRERKDTL